MLEIARNFKILKIDFFKFSRTKGVEFITGVISHPQAFFKFYVKKFYSHGFSYE